MTNFKYGKTRILFQTENMKKVLSFILSLFAITTFAQSWEEINKIVSPQRGSFDQFGFKLSSNNDELFISNHNKDHGEIIVKQKDIQGHWKTTQTITPPELGQDFQFLVEEFGSVFASSDDFLVVGSYKSENHNQTWTDGGMVFIYEKKQGSWSLMQTITPHDNHIEEDWFGRSVAIKDNLLIIGKQENISGSGQGSI